MSNRELPPVYLSDAAERLSVGPNRDWLDKLADLNENVSNLFNRKRMINAPETQSVEGIIEISGHPRV